jgi:hypothetical protein
MKEEGEVAAESEAVPGLEAEITEPGLEREEEGWRDGGEPCCRREVSLLLTLLSAESERVETP